MASSHHFVPLSPCSQENRCGDEPSPSVRLKQSLSPPSPCRAHAIREGSPVLSTAQGDRAQTQGEPKLGPNPTDQKANTHPESLHQRRTLTSQPMTATSREWPRMGHPSQPVNSPEGNPGVPIYQPTHMRQFKEPTRHHSTGSQKSTQELCSHRNQGVHKTDLWKIVRLKI